MNHRAVSTSRWKFSQPFGFDQFQTELSTLDPKNRNHFLGPMIPGSWYRSTRTRSSAVLNTHRSSREAAFYAPRLDVKLVDAIASVAVCHSIRFPQPAAAICLSVSLKTARSTQAADGARALYDQWSASSAC